MNRNIKVIILLGINLLLISKCLSQEYPIVESITVENESYEHAQVTNIDANIVVIKHDDGIARISKSGIDNATLDKLIPGYLNALRKKAKEEAAAKLANEQLERKKQQEQEELAKEEKKLSEKKEKEQERANSSISHQTGSLTSISNGYDWNRVTDTEKRQYAALMANVQQRLAPGITSSYIYEALCEFYRSDDPQILRQRLPQIVGLTVLSYTKGY